MTAELWADIAPGYSVSNLGRVRGKSGRILNPSPNSRGYLTFSVGRKSVKLHVAVAKHHVPGWFEGAEVRHLNGIPSDCAASNLAWGTHSENMADIVRHGNHSQANQTHCPQGHGYTLDNTTNRSGRRNCRECARESQRRYRATHRDRLLAARREHERKTRPFRSKASVLARKNLTEGATNGHA